MSQHGDLGDTARRWLELHGEGGWDGLLDPLHLDLRRTMLRYGEMAQATYYDTFNHEALSPHAGLPRFARARFFDRVRLPGHAAAYLVTRFLYVMLSFPVPGAFILRSASGAGRCKESNACFRFLRRSLQAAGGDERSSACFRFLRRSQ